jgi:hypothetical protein
MYSTYVTIAVVLISAVIVTLSCFTCMYRDLYNDLLRRHEMLRRNYDLRGDDLEASLRESRTLRGTNKELRQSLSSSKHNLELISDTIEKALKV